MGENREYKSSVFSLLFSEPEVLRELYSTLEGVTLPPDVPITINTLQNVLFQNRINDISFEIGTGACSEIRGQGRRAETSGALLPQ